jgi:hypothetical protein
MPGYGSSTTVGSVRIANVSVAGGYALTYDDGPIGGWDETLSRFDSNGAPTVITNWVTSRIGFPPPVVDSQGNFYSMENLPSQLPVSFIKHTPSGLAIWGKDFGYTTQILVGRDFYDGAHVADTNSHLSRYDLDGNLVWTMSLPSNCQEMFVDGSGNRFVSLLGGAIARIGDETFSALSITNAPQPLTVLAGSNAVLSVGASGSTPLRYFWYFNNSLLSAQTNAPLNLFPATTNQSGSYYVVVSNQVNSVTSAPVQLRVKQVELFIGGQLLTNGTYTFLTNPIITVQSDFTNGSVFYTLDGSAPTFLSTPYSGPFGLFSNATVRALGYSADFSHSEEADAVDAIVLAHHSLVASSPGGGSITLNPPGGDYLSSTTVTATAVPDAGWSFLHWTGAATGANPSVEILMHSDQSLHAVFGTTLSTTVQGDGQVLLYPPGGFYSYGQIVRLTGVPNAGSYFGAWGNAASGNTNPLYFTVTNSNPTVSSIFGTNGANQVSLSVLINGRGDVNVSPSANVYTAGQSVTLSATAGPGQSFANWSGDAGGSQNPLTVVLNQGKVITANFSGGPILRVNSQLGEGMNLDGFRFSLLSDSGSIYEIRSSTNLKSWQSMGYVTNQTGEMQLLDSAGTNSPQKFYRTFP